MKIGIKPLRRGARLPSFGSPEAAGADICANLTKMVTLEPGTRYIVPTGLAIDIPKGYEVQVRPRSGLAAKFGVTVLNAPGTIDSDYTGELGVILINLGDEDFPITNGDRIAQIVLKKVESPSYEWAIDDLRKTQRGADGFGSTGV